MTSQDVITFKPKKISFVSNDKDLKLFEDENLALVVKFLRKGAMTIPDLMVAFEKHADKKSDKSIYRYLSKLIKGKLVAKAGKRITTTTANDLQSETLYIRTADAFILKRPLTEVNKDGAICSPFYETMYHTLKPLFGDNPKGMNKFIEFFDKFDNEKDNFIISLYNNASKEVSKQIRELECSDIFYALDYASWIAILMKYDLKEDLDKIYSL